MRCFLCKTAEFLTLFLRAFMTPFFPGTPLTVLVVSFCFPSLALLHQLVPWTWFFGVSLLIRFCYFTYVVFLGNKTHGRSRLLMSALFFILLQWDRHPPGPPGLKPMCPLSLEKKGWKFFSYNAVLSMLFKIPCFIFYSTEDFIIWDLLFLYIYMK